MTTELAAARARVAELEASLSRAVARDPLVPGMLSLRAFRSQLNLDIERAHRYSRPLALAILDVDRFRDINLKHGMVGGDLVLGAVGRAVTDGTRVHDHACRIAGDEFAILLPETGIEEAVAALGRILVALESAEVRGVDGIAASVGISALAPRESAEPLLDRARQAMERARSEGGGRISVLEPGAAVQSSAGEPQGDGAVAALASALSERDRYTGDHSESVVDLTARVGEALALAPSEIHKVRIAALLHDIGKVGVPDAILNKPGPLDAAEWEIMRQHPAIGERILRAIPGMGAIARIVRHEHERWDGGGYPDRLSGTEIPIGARIILACDAYHAMTSDRPYRKSIGHVEAMKELSDNAGSQFDPAVVEALVGYMYGRRQSGLAAV